MCFALLSACLTVLRAPASSPRIPLLLAPFPKNAAESQRQERLWPTHPPRTLCCIERCRYQRTLCCTRVAGHSRLLRWQEGTLSRKRYAQASCLLHCFATVVLAVAVVSPTVPSDQPRARSESASRMLKQVMTVYAMVVIDSFVLLLPCRLSRCIS
jgi:hypothetical protein